MAQATAPLLDSTLASVRAHALKGRYWSKSGERVALGLDGLVRAHVAEVRGANGSYDLSQNTFALLCEHIYWIIAKVPNDETYPR